MEVVRKALSFGAGGFVAKTRAEQDLLAAVDAVLAGSRFVSLGLSYENFTAAGPTGSIKVP